MKTEVEMKRELFGIEISQKSKSEFFSATDLLRAGNRWRRKHDLNPFSMSLYFKKESTIEFMHELEKEFGKVLFLGRGRKAQTWVHPLLFIDMALTIHPRLKIEVYKWLFDNLIKFRNNSGDSYKKMCGALYNRCTNFKEFPKIISNIADQIREACDVEDWEHASEKQLDKREKIQNSICTLTNVLTNINQIVRIAIQENK